MGHALKTRGVVREAFEELTESQVCATQETRLAMDEYETCVPGVCMPHLLPHRTCDRFLTPGVD